MFRLALPLILLTSALAPAVVRAGKLDLAFVKLCPHDIASGLNGGGRECSWVKRDSVTGVLTGPVKMDADAESHYRSLMSEMGVVMAPRLQTPADTLGFAGFQFSAELSVTQIHNRERYWDGVEVVTVQNPNNPERRPDAWLTTVGGFVRKGIWLPLPGFELGVGAMNLVGSRMVALQGYAKFALHEGFHDWVLPSVAVRGGISRITGTDQVQLTVGSFDISISKAFGIGGTARLEPFGGWNLLFIDARSEVIDGTPQCDAYTTQTNAAPLGASCANAQAGRDWNDLNANFVFPDQDVITRNRVFGGFKLKFAILALVAQYEFTAAGTTRDSKRASGSPTGARDTSGNQQGVSLSAGFDF